VVLASVLVATLTVSPLAFGEDHLRGVVAARGNDGTVTVRADDSSMVTVVLNEATKIKRTDGIRAVKVDAASLIPGLRVKVEGTLEGNRFTAGELTFTRADLKTALAILAAIDPTDRRSIDNQQRLDQLAGNLDAQKQALGQTQQQIASQSERIRANEEKIVGTSGTLAATNARIANLDDYTVVSSTTVYFKNGRYTIDPQTQSQLQQFAEQTKGLQGYVIQVEGYASDVGPNPNNQRLSLARAAAVAAVLHQSGIPSTSMLAPAAMGVSQQVAPNTTRKGQAENRRTVVTVLQNKGISGQ
jgi:outer membrane protein OmpA-like peptidoglycan-associated protein